MDAHFRKTLKRVALAHLSLFLIFVAGHFLLVLWQKLKPREQVTIIELADAVPAPPAPQAPTPPPPKPPEPKPPEPKPEPKPRKEIVPSKKRVKREESPKPPPPKPQLTPEQLEKMLAKDLPRPATPSPVSSALPDWYLQMVKAVMYDAWQQPSDLGNSRLAAVVAIRIERDGRLSSKDLLRPSGDAVMDQSIRQALASVSHVKPLPADFPGRSREVEIEFRLTGTVL